MVSLYSFIVIELCHWFVIAMFLCFKLSFNYDLLYHVVHRQTSLLLVPKESIDKNIDTDVRV